MKNLTIEGSKAKAMMIFCDITSEEYNYMPVVFHFENSTIILKQLTFTSSHLFAVDAKLTIEDCVFNDSVIFLMQQDYLKLFTNFSEYEFVGENYKVAIEEISFLFARNEKYSLESLPELEAVFTMKPLTCIYVDIILNNVEWYPSKATQPPPPLDTPKLLGLQAICHNISITMTSCNMSDNPVQLLALITLQANVENVVFAGSASGSDILGGLHFRSFSYSSVQIENCFFAHIKYNSMVYAEVSAVRYISAALTIVLQSSRSRSYNSPPRALQSAFHIILSNLTFQNNLRAIAITSPSAGWAKSQPYPYIKIKNSSFDKNQVSTSGAAVLVNSPRVVVHFEHCEFLENAAGVVFYNLASNSEPTSVRLTAGTTLTVFSVEFQSQNILSMDVKYQHNKIVRNKTILHQIKGNGGAIAVESASYVQLVHCHLRNNTANNLGAAIFLNHDIRSTNIKNTALVIGDVPLTLKSGLLLHSFSQHMFLQNVSFTVLKTLQKAVSVVAHHHHPKKAGKSDNSLDVNALTVHCPRNSRLLLQNTSSSNLQPFLKYPTYSNPILFASFADLFHSCIPCPADFYSLGSGYLQLNVQQILPSKKESVKRFVPLSEATPPSPATTAAAAAATAPPPPPPPPPDILLPETAASSLIDLYNYRDVMCKPCPYGGVCGTAGIQAKANHWGITEEDSAVQFYLCPPGYCCSEPVCGTYNTCNSYRTGTLCSQCKTGYSETLFSTTCVPDEECNNYWYILIHLVMVFVCALILLFQSNLETFISQSPFKRLWTSQKSKIQELTENSKVIEPDCEQQSSLCLVLLFYFQDATLVHFTPIFAKGVDPLLSLLTNFASAVFDFKIDTTAISSAVCAVSNLGPVTKIGLKLLTIPSVFIALAAVYFLSQFLCAVLPHHFRTIKAVIVSNFSRALLLAMLCSFQDVASSTFLLVYCVPIQGHNVLFYEANIKCYQKWQIVVLLCAAFSIVPFAVFLTVAPSFLKNGSMTLRQFYLGCLCPGPVGIYLILSKHYRKVNKNSFVGRNATFEVYEVLQGSYNNYFIQLPLVRNIHLCWGGILLLKRLVLVLLYTQIHNIMLRLLCMTVVCFLSLLYHLMVQPCKKTRDNRAGTVSGVALLTVCLINLIRAIFEVTEVIPEGKTKQILDGLHLVEDSLLLWFPIIGASVLLILLLGSLFELLLRICTKSRLASMFCSQFFQDNNKVR